MEKNHESLLEHVSSFPKWKLDSLMLDDSDLELRKQIEAYKSKKEGKSAV